MKKIVSIICLVVTALAVASSCDRSEQDFEKAQQIHTSEAYLEFIKNHSKADLAEVARDSVVAIYSRNIDLKKIQEKNYGIADISINRRLNELIQQRAQMAYELAQDINTVEGWKTFILNTPANMLQDAEARLQEREEDALWGSESIAWETANSRNTLAAFGKYLGLYPKGKHVREAEKRYVDLDVASVFAGKHGTLPQMDKGYSTGTSYSVIEIENRTQYELTVSYSGPDSKRVVLQPGATKKVNINNGHYMVAARCGHGVIPYAGQENLDGSYYSSSFYISTSRY
ncbi:MAG: hypothetical protein IJ761_01280 [Bacteroidales bacterium]|nr:hypothetical protein [Bacteroidales bacterium]